MLPDPLHPAVVHVPIALAALLPLLTLAGLLAIRAAWLPARAWSAVVLLALLLVLGSWFALETGEEEEERVERVVAEEFIEVHEEAAETFMVLGVLLLLIAAGGLVSGRPGELARAAAVVAALVLLAAGARVGHLGGELVYVHGAADAYSGAGGAEAWAGDDNDDDTDSN